MKLVLQARIYTDMFFTRTRSLLILVMGCFMAVLLCGCGDDEGGIEFSSEVPNEDLDLGDLIGEGDGIAAPGAVGAGAARAESKAIHFFSPAFDRPFSVVQMRLFQAFVNQAGGPPVRLHDGKDDAALQEAELLAAVNAGARGIVLSPVDPAPLRDAVVRGLELGIPIVVLGSSREELPGSVNLPVDYYQVGQMAAEFVIQRLTIKAEAEGLSEVAGEIIEVTAREDLETDLESKVHAGFSSVIGRYPAVKIVHQAPGLWHTLGGAERVAEAMRIQPGANVVFCHNDAMAYGVYLALKDQDKAGDFLVVGVDGISGPDGGIVRVRDQMLGATVAVPLLSRHAAKSVLALIEGEAVPQFEELHPELVTIANSPEMYQRHMQLPFGEQRAKEAEQAASSRPE